MLPDVVFIKTMFHVANNFEYGLGLLIVDAEVELLETGKDLTKLIHGGLKSLQSTEAPAKMTIVRIQHEMVRPAWSSMNVNMCTKESSHSCPQSGRPSAALT